VLAGFYGVLGSFGFGITVDDCIGGAVGSQVFGTSCVDVSFCTYVLGLTEVGRVFVPCGESLVSLCGGPPELNRCV
jgi:hypothetical protein